MTRIIGIDAALWLLAGVDFLQGACVEPSVEVQARARVEGWIWFRG